MHESNNNKEFTELHTINAKGFGFKNNVCMNYVLLIFNIMNITNGIQHDVVPQQQVFSKVRVVF